MRNPASSIVYMPKMTGGRVFRRTNGMSRPISFSGKGVGSFLLDGGMGGQSSYSSIDDYVSTVERPRPVKGGAISSSLAKIGGKLSDMMIKPEMGKSRRKNINFSL